MAEISLQNPFIFKIKEIVNLRTEAQPLWGLEFHIDSALREHFANLFDPIMCPDKGVTYCWNPCIGQITRAAHITLGDKKEDYELAHRLLELNGNFIFGQADYKKTVPHDHIHSQKLNDSPSITGSYGK